MANYSIKLTPDLRNMSTEGSLDTSLLNGKSLQRTFHDLDVIIDGNRKKVGNFKDGDTFNDSFGDLGDVPGVVAE